MEPLPGLCYRQPEMYAVTVMKSPGVGMMTRWAVVVMAVFEFTVLTSAYADPPKPNVSWESLYSDEGITTERGLVDDSPFLAFRGTGIVEARIGKVISILFDHPRANEWVYELVASKTLRALSNHGVVVWQRFENP